MGSGGKNNNDKTTARAAGMAVDKIYSTSPSEQLLKERTEGYFNWANKAGRSIEEMPGMSPYLKLNQSAEQKAQQERKGIGALALGDSGQSQATGIYKEFMKNQRGRDYASRIEDAAATRHGEALGLGMNLAQMEANKNQAAANLAVNRESIYNKPKQEGGWGQAILQTAGAVAGAAIMASDERLKDDIEELPYGLETVDKLRPKKYKMGGQEQVGFLAQDVEQVMPEVTGEMEGGVKGIYYQNMVPLLASAIQDLKKELDAVKKSKQA